MAAGVGKANGGCLFVFSFFFRFRHFFCKPGSFRFGLV